MTQGKDPRIRVLVIDDSSFTRTSMLRMFEKSPDIEIIGVAGDGAMGVAMVEELRPDVVTLDVKMPVMDGLTALARIMAQRPTPVIMLSSSTGKGGEDTIKALQLGAVDFIDKSSVGSLMELSALTGELAQKIRVAAYVKMPVGNSPEPPPPGASKRRSGGERAEVVLIGTSTGGPAALTAVLSRLPADFPCPILVVQHMPPGFTGPLAERLNKNCAVAVKEAEEGEVLAAGCAYIAPAGKHLKVKRRGDDLLVRLDLHPGQSLHRPSVDVLLESAAEVCGKGCLAFVLTGMGSDGAAGAVHVKKSGGRVFVESEKTCVVFGMPRAVAALVTVDGSLPLPEVAETMSRLA